MKHTITILLLALFASTAHGRFSKFALVTPGFETPERYKAYISTNPVLTIAESNTNTVTVTIPLKDTKQHQQYWLIRCKTPIEKGKMDFRQYVWEHKRYKQWVQRIEQDERLTPEARSELIKNHPLKSRNDVETIESLNVGKEDTDIVLAIPESEIDRTYVYRDYPSMIVDGGYYYCFDIPAYYKKQKAEQAATQVQSEGAPSD
jgi:hypothetical protein